MTEKTGREPEAPPAPSGVEATVAAAVPSAVEATIVAGSSPPTGAEATVVPDGSVQPHVTIRAGRRDDYSDLLPIDRQHYVVGDELARGGMGRILTARDRRLGRDVAIKELLVDSPALRMRFEREARITAKLQHPSIVNILEAGTWPSGEAFYVMKLVSGESLDRVIAARPTLPERLALLPNAIAAVDALAYAHDHRVIHRDLKPANVLVGKYGETVVIDWGLAKDLADTTDAPEIAVGPYRSAAATPGATMAGAVMGTPAYMPVEQALGEAVDERADVYSLGAMLYHLLAGEPPYTGKSADAILAKVIKEPFAPLEAVAPTVPPDLVTIVTKAMAREAVDRYASASALADDLKKFQTGQLVGAHHYSSWELVRRWARRHRGVLSVAGLAIAVVAVLSILGIRQILSERDRAEHNEQTAEAHRVKTEELVDFMSTDLQTRLEAIGKLELFDVVAKRVLAHYDGSAAEDDSARRRHATALRTLGDVAFARGDTAVAEAQFEQALAMLEPIAARDRTTATLNQTYYKTRDQLLRLQRGRGENDKALAGYRAMLDELAAIPGKPAWISGVVSVAWFQIGVISADQGNHEAARDAYKHSVEVDRVRLAADASDANRISLARALSRSGEAQLALGDAATALATFREVSAIDEELLRHSPKDAERLRSVAISHFKIGEVMQAQSEYKKSLAAFEQALAAGEQLVALDSTRLDFQNLVATCHQKVGDQHQSLNDMTKAKVSFLEYVELTERLTKAEPTNAGYQQGAAFAHMRMANVYAEEKNPKAALAEFEEVLQRQARRFETTKLVGIRLESAWVHQQIAGILDSIGKPVEAEASLRRAVSEAEQAIAVHPKNVTWQEYAFRARYMLAKLLKERGRPRDALPIYRTAATELEQVVTGKAGLVSSRRDSSVAWEKVAIVELELRELADAERDIRHAIALMTELAAEKPDDASLVESAADQQGTLADILVAKGDRVGAKAALTKALAQLDPVKAPKLVKTLRDKLARCCS